MELHDGAPPQVNDDGTGTISPADETGKRDGVDGAESLAARRDGAVVQALEAMNVTWSRARTNWRLLRGCTSGSQSFRPTR